MRHEPMARASTLRWSAVGATLIAGVLVAIAAFSPVDWDPPIAFPEAVVPEVPYVPTPAEVVELMLDTARVGMDDVVYDLGCGDGRIVIAAARRGARGVGIDVDPRRIEEATELARRAGVADRVRFVLGDLFAADVREATVVALYLLPTMNMRLRPKLWNELAPGTRVVSHNYGMGDWLPVERRQVGNHVVLLWVIPSDLHRATR